MSENVKGLLDVPFPIHIDSVWTAMAFRAGTVADKDPPETANEAPVHDPEALAPLITSQYVPSASNVVKVVLHGESSLLMATKPADPRPKAIRLERGETQLFIGSAPTVLRKPVIPEIAVQRCWQIHPFSPRFPAHVPTLPLGAPASKVVNPS